MRRGNPLERDIGGFAERAPLLGIDHLTADPPVCIGGEGTVARIVSVGGGAQAHITSLLQIIDLDVVSEHQPNAPSNSLYLGHTVMNCILPVQAAPGSETSTILHRVGSTIK